MNAPTKQNKKEIKTGNIMLDLAFKQFAPALRSMMKKDGAQALVLGFDKDGNFDTFYTAETMEQIKIKVKEVVKK